MDKLVNEFVVNRPIDQTWAVLTDVERIAPCMPGAELQEIEGDIYRGVVKVKLGAISTAFKGQASFLERDDANHRAVLKGEGRDTGGKGNADALITAQLVSVDANTTTCQVQTDLRITGKVAQFGRGIMGEVSKKLMDQFATNLNTMLDEQAPVDVAAPVEAATPAAAVAAATPSAPVAEAATMATAAAESVPATPVVRKIDGPAAKPIDIGDVAGAAVLKRALPVIVGIVVVAVLLWIVL